MRVVIVPDSFKGSFSAEEVCGIVADAVRELVPGAVTDEIPVADGGEGSVDAFLVAVGGERVERTVTGPYGAPAAAFYGLLPDGTAVVEMAAAAGLPLVGEDRRTRVATTYGVGELVSSALDRGVHRLVVGLGGSVTTDGGTGAAAALGVRFLDEQDDAFLPVGETLRQIARIDATGIDPRLAATDIEGMCDVDNPLTGPAGAAAIFGPQKGATGDDVALLDDGLAHLARLIERDLGIDVAGAPGAGAAGGLGAGVIAFLAGTLRPGIETVLDILGADERIAEADLVVTGEGSFDSQSLRGKVISGVARRCSEAGVPLVVLAGRVDDDVRDDLARLGIAGAYAITPPGEPLVEALANAEENLRRTALAVLGQHLSTDRA